jgi:hypothetical protein
LPGWMSSEREGQGERNEEKGFAQINERFHKEEQIREY